VTKLRKVIREVSEEEDEERSLILLTTLKAYDILSILEDMERELENGS
jgi:hypothetical protein